MQSVIVVFPDHTHLLFVYYLTDFDKNVQLIDLIDTFSLLIFVLSSFAIIFKRKRELVA